MTRPLNSLKRYPVRKNDLLQAWDSADELILQHLENLDLKQKRILIINDSFGAVSFALSEWDITAYTDSFVSYMGTRINTEEKIIPLNDLGQLTGKYDFVLLKIPKNMSFMEDILARLTHHLHSESQIICGAMVKHLPTTSFDLLGKYIGETSTSLAQKKARLIFAKFQKSPERSPYPQSIQVESFEKPFINHSNLFSREKLDIGTRFFLEHIPKGQFTNILDLGCANGIIGIKAKMLNKNATIFFSDESAMAIQSAQDNYQDRFNDVAEYFWTNCFEGQPKGTMDLVLCNPPFHQGNTVGDFIAWQMFQDSYNVLKPGGTLRIIGNSHLGYQHKLKKLFGNFKIVATNNKFMICEATKN